MADKTKDKEPVLIEPVAKDPKFFEWLESLFDGASQFPEKIEVRAMQGRTFGALVKQIIYPPMPNEKVPRGDGDKTEKAKSGKPTREDLVALSNELLYRMQRDCDAAGRPTTYNVLAAHFAREVDFYDRWPFALKPANVVRGQEGEYADDDVDGLSMDKKFGKHILDHGERMFNMYGGAIEGVIDRYDRVRERDQMEIDRLREENRNLREERERMSVNDHERRMASAWNELKIDSVKKGLDMAIGLAPPLLNQIAGKTVVPTTETAESITLKRFFKLDKDGGLLTVAQADAAFGSYDDTPESNLVVPGALSQAQAKLLYDVAHCAIPADSLDRLLPDGDLAVGMDQIAKLQQIFTAEQITPIIALIGIRMQRRAQQNQSQNQQQQSAQK